MKPTKGRIVLYMLTAYDASTINQRRQQASDKAAWHAAIQPGLQNYSGNSVKESDIFPMVIVAIWGPEETSAVNGQVLLDGNDSYWATSVAVGTGPGTFSWPMAPAAAPVAEEKAPVTEA